MYVDLTGSTFESGYEELLRCIYDMPRFVKPSLGSAPSFLVQKATKAMPAVRTGSARGLADCGWAELKAIANEISAASSDGEGLDIARSYGLVDSELKLRGDSKTFELSTGLQTAVRIVGFRHDELADGSGRKSGITFEFADIPVVRRMNSTWTNSGGWAACEMRDWLNSEFLALLPEDLRSKIVEVRKRTNNRGRVRGNDTSVVTAARDKIWLLSMTEVYGELSNNPERAPWFPVIYEAEGTQYKLYADYGVSTTSYAFCEKAGADSWWWLRSPRASGDHSFRGASTDGTWAHGAGYQHGVSPCFCF